jgi:DNA-binding CsgD family transcriptional regulator
MIYCAERDLDSRGQYLQSWRARVRLNQGDWAAAAEDALPLVTRTLLPAVVRLPALTVIAWLRVRRGDPGAQAVLDEVRDLAAPTGEMQRIVPVAAARAEFAWLHGDLSRCREEAWVGYVLARNYRNPWQLGEIAYWLWRGEGLEEAPHWLAEPYRLMISGQWQAAAAEWGRLGSVYQRALALSDGDEQAQREALAIFEGMSARPAADLVRRRLHEQGVRGTNPHGLTNRQFEIVGLLAEGLRNAEIAERLSTSAKTVEHHVSAVLGKLGVRSRAEAVALAHQMGVVPAQIGSPQSEVG